uniref:Uncharacterized protein n=1 Tax=Oryza sativa subsp. japonica TaxID=39947 RepID=Q84R89_ORYSJ|nr:hypothetical protein [Oryza sativa Japonica Group]
MPRPLGGAAAAADRLGSAAAAADGLGGSASVMATLCRIRDMESGRGLGGVGTRLGTPGQGASSQGDEAGGDAPSPNFRAPSPQCAVARRRGVEA